MQNPISNMEENDDYVNESTLHEEQDCKKTGNRFSFGKLYESYWMDPDQFGYWRLGVLCIVVLGICGDFIIDHDLKYPEQFSIGTQIFPS
jgi:hypothetical protein